VSGLALASRGPLLAWLAAAVAVPLGGLFLLLGAPRLDFLWEHHPAHFWLVLAAAVTNCALAVLTGDAARRRADARLFLVSLAFLSAAGFLALHALATPGVLLDQPNTGFVVATPVGLLLAALFALASSLDFEPERSAGLMRHAVPARLGLLALMGAWAAVSLAGVWPLDRPLPPDEAEGRLIGLAVPGIALYALAGVQYLRHFRRRPARVLLAVVTAFVLLAEAMLAIALARNWHATWWEWHVLMLAAFAIVAVSARRDWREERFVDISLPGAVREVSVLFGDLEGFTPYSERVGPERSARVVGEYFDRLGPLAKRYGGDSSLIGDAIMVSFNTRGDQPDHATRAVRAALLLQREAAQIAEEHSDWPRFRVGVNTGPAQIGVVGGEHTPIGDTVNLAARLEGHAEVGQVVVGSQTYRSLPDGTEVEPLGGVQVKGKEAPVEAYVVLGLPARDEGREGL
jgi:adenylate cyclase